MAIAIGTGMAIMGAVSLGMSVFSGIKGIFKRRKAKKQLKQFQMANRMRQMQMMAQMRQFAAGSGLMVGGMGQGYMQPCGMTQGYGAAPGGFYPPCCGR